VTDRLDAAFARQDVAAMTQMARDLIDIPSPTGEEYEIGEYVARRYAELGMEVQRQEVEPGRNNIIARLHGSRPGPTLLLLAHFDTSSNPDDDLPMGFQAKSQVKDGWLYGLGISNMKNAFAGYWSMIQMLRDGDIDLPGEIVVAGVVGEIEKGPVDLWQGKAFRGGGLGARFLINHGVTANAAINGEPTGLRLQTGNAGYLFIRIAIKGKPQATFSKQVAVDPIPKAIRLYQALQDWEPKYIERHPHPLMKPLIGVGGIYGGFPYKPSMTPPFCNLYVHVNLIPGQSIIGVQREIEELISDQKADDPELDAVVRIFVASNGHLLDEDHPLVDVMKGSHERVFGEPVGRPNPERFSVSSDNSPLAEFGIPAVTYGAGGVNISGQYNMYEPGVGEVVKIDNLAACARVYLAAADRLQGAT
jgi:acetylornithine deacetylase/succinyl-diaminopimelate desuccinylase-like protein